MDDNLCYCDHMQFRSLDNVMHKRQLYHTLTISLTIKESNTLKNNNAFCFKSNAILCLGFVK